MVFWYVMLIDHRLMFWLLLLLMMMMMMMVVEGEDCFDEDQDRFG